MNARINEALKNKLAHAEESDTVKGIAVIATLIEGADPEALEQKGFKIQNYIDSIRAVSMVLTADEIRELAQLELVELIEYDGAGVWPL